MAQTVSRLPLTAETRVRSQASQRESCGGESGPGTGFSPKTSGFPYQYHSTRAVYSPSSTCCFYQKKKRASLGTFNMQCSSGNQREIDRKVFNLVFKGLMLHLHIS